MRQVLSRLSKLLPSGLGQRKRGGMLRESRYLFTVVEPRDLMLYRSLLPDRFSMPDLPLIAFYLIDLVDVAPWPMTPYREGAVLLGCRYKSVEGWYVKDMPLTRWIPMVGGRWLGFPKRLVDEVTLDPANTGWTGEVRRLEKMELMLEFTPGAMGEQDSRVDKILSEGPMNITCLLLVPPERGPKVQKVIPVHVVPPVWSSAIPGTVSITIAPEVPWTGLVSSENRSPGVFGNFRGGINLVTQKLG